MAVYRRVLSYALKYKFLVIFCVIFAVVSALSKVGTTLAGTSFFSDNFIDKNIENIKIQSILLLIGGVFLWASSHYFIFICSNTLSSSVMHDIRKDIFEKLVDLPISYYKKNRTGEILSRLLNDMGIIEIFFMNIAVELLQQPMIIIMVVSVMLAKNTRISLYLFSIVPVIGLVLWGIGSLVQRLSMSVQKNISSITSNIQESIYGIEVIKGYGVESSIKEKFSRTNDIYLKSSKREIKIRFLGTPSSEFLGSMAVILILVLGAVSVQRHVATSSEILSFIALSLLLAEPLSRTSDIFMILKKLSSAAHRIFEIIDYEEREDVSRPGIGKIQGGIEFKNVSFEYDTGMSTLRDISLSIKPGETVAIVGHSGAGKSSLISLIPAFYKCTKGTVLIDGLDINLYNPVSIRKQIGLVTQDNILFSGSIMENIKLSKPGASEDEVVEAAELAFAHSFVTKLPEGYNTMLGDRGVRLSGGEKQRIALARALLRKPGILILDEATSSLDAESENLIQKAMKRILGRQTTIIVTHKLATISDADSIIVMEEGKIIETGNHRELIDNGGIYKRLIGLQINV